jgi:hypothetical protein
MNHAYTNAGRRHRLRALAILAVLVGACDGTDRLANNDPTTTMDGPTTGPVAGADSVAAADPSLTPEFATATYTYGTRFGAFDCTHVTGLSAYNLCNQAAGSWSAYYVGKLQALGAKAILNQGGYAKFKDSRGRYSPTKYYYWVQSLKPYAASWKPYVLNGTLVGVQVIDDRLASNWGGVSITNAQIDQMARWWKQLVPGITAFVSGGYASNLLGYTWYYLDGSINQYNARYMGSVTTWRDNAVAAARTARTSLILSLNVLGGGKLVSGCYHGYSSTTCSMSPTELKTYGAAIAAASGICGLGTWKFNSTYQARYGVSDALRYVARLAAARSAASCKRR